MQKDTRLSNTTCAIVGECDEPKTLEEAIVYFSNLDHTLAYAASRRWLHGIACPACGSKEVRSLAKQRRWECKYGDHLKKQFSVKVGTVMDSPIGLDKWLIAMWAVANSKNGVSSYKIKRDLGRRKPHGSCCSAYVKAWAATRRTTLSLVEFRIF